MTIVKTARWWIQKYTPQNVNKFDISAGNENVTLCHKAVASKTVHTIDSLTLMLTSKQDAVSLKFQVLHESQKYADPLAFAIAISLATEFE